KILPITHRIALILHVRALLAGIGRQRNPHAFLEHLTREVRAIERRRVVAIGAVLVRRAQITHAGSDDALDLFRLRQRRYGIGRRLVGGANVLRAGADVALRPVTVDDLVPVLVRLADDRDLLALRQIADAGTARRGRLAEGD